MREPNDSAEADPYVSIESGHELYDWGDARALPYDFAAIREPADILGFARKWGLLWSGASFDDDESPFEALDEWMAEVVYLNWLLFLYATYRSAQAEDREGFAAALLYQHAFFTGNLGTLSRDLLRPHKAALPLRADVVPEDVELDDVLPIMEDIEDELIDRLWGRLEKTVGLTVGVVENIFPTGARPPGEFILEAEPENLLARAYLQLALEMTEHQTSLSVCPEDGRIFPVRDPRQRYCSTRCAGRARQRRFGERKKVGGS